MTQAAVMLPMVPLDKWASECVDDEAGLALSLGLSLWSRYGVVIEGDVLVVDEGLAG